MPPAPHASKRVMLLGATGEIGRAVAAALVARGHEVVCFVRPKAGVGGALTPETIARLLPGAALRFGEITRPDALAAEGFRGERFDALVSCLASRTGAPKDAFAIDRQAHLDALGAARDAGVTQMVLLSAICVQRPRLAFQHAKLAFEEALIRSGLSYAIVRPTAYFKSLSGQIDRLRQGKPFLLFGDGRQTACKPISAGDLGAYLADCLTDPARADRILPIGGPGPAITPREQGERLFALLGAKPRFRSIPLALLNGIVGALSTLGRLSPWLDDKAEFARIAQYYATESMLLFDPATGRYDAAATPSYGSETLFDHYERLVSGGLTDARDDHAMF